MPPGYGSHYSLQLHECVDGLIHSPISPCSTHEAFAQSFYQITNFSEIVQVTDSI